MPSDNKPAAAQEAVAWYYGFADTGEAGPVTFGGNPGAEAIEWAERHGHTLHYLYAAPVAAAPVEMSPEFTDTARAAIAWVLWHHQGGSSPIGQPLRFALGMGDHEPLPDWRIAEAKRYAGLAGATTADFHKGRGSTPAAPVDCCPHCGGTAGHWEGCRAPADAPPPAAPGIDLEQFRPAVCAMGLYAEEPGDVDEAKRLLALIDASPKCRNIPSPRIELTNGQIAQLADFAGTPMAGEPLEDQDVLVIQHSDAGHSGPGVYAHYDELPEEGAIYLDGQLPDSPKGGSDAHASMHATGIATLLWKELSNAGFLIGGPDFESVAHPVDKARFLAIAEVVQDAMQPTSHGAGVSDE